MNNNQQANLKISLLPLVVIIGLIIGAGYLLMDGEIKLPKFNEGPQIRRLEGFPTIVYTDKVIEKQRKVIKSEQELADFLNLIDPSGLLEVKDKVNFKNEYLVAVTSETKDTTKYGIKIRKLYEDKAQKSLLVSIRELEPDPSCDLEPDKNIAVDIAAISKTEDTIDFERVKEVVKCN